MQLSNRWLPTCPLNTRLILIINSGIHTIEHFLVQLVQEKVNMT